ncbi:hypothetical protein PhaeoP78_00346 [Phaeobacter inhibens]|nr:hypothetical protein PhaeoP78_00346 [Phaeobacter inhibens]
MIEVLTYLREREEEFARHLAIARMIEGQVDDHDAENDILVEVRHVNTLKSGLLIHLYNIVEAITTRTLAAVGQAIVVERPKLWTGLVRKEWIRAEVWSGEDRIGENVINRLSNISGTLASGQSPEAFKIKGEPGSWDNKSIKKVAERLGCNLNFSPDVGRGAFERVYRNETTAMEYLAKRRNDIAHGSTTFEEGAFDMTLDDLERLALRIIPFLREVSVSYQTYLEGRVFLLQVEQTA